MKARDLLLAAIGMALYQIAASLDDRRMVARQQTRALIARCRRKGVTHDA